MLLALEQCFCGTTHQLPAVFYDTTFEGSESDYLGQWQGYELDLASALYQKMMAHEKGMAEKHERESRMMTS